MRTATVADLRNDFRRLSAFIDEGETVEITKRGKVYARLSPAVDSPKKLVKPDIMARLKEDWGDRVFTDAEVKEMRELELGDNG